MNHPEFFPHMPLLASTLHTALPPLGMVLPFVALLLCIALLPIFALHFWERHYPKVALLLALVTAGYYAGVRREWEPLHHAAREYVGFMALVGSLYVISGGISIRVRGAATPMVNTLYLLIGAVLANLIGTTGASMLLVRPWIRMNRHRITSFHIVFFIFVVSNVGGCLTPIGDPPLFLGFLRGVPFSWVLTHCWSAWLLALTLLLAVFYGFDALNFRRAPQQVRQEKTEHEEWHFRGLLNVFWLGVVLVAGFLPASLQNMAIFGVVTVPALLMAAAAIASWFTTRSEVHEANDFNFGPVREVGFLFAGIFVTMIPALQLLQGGGVTGIDTALHYYFATGSLSAFLDNAPTYLAFLAAAMGRAHLSVDSPADVAAFASEHAGLLMAISLGAVFFGAASYIGNGPNFMVKAIAEASSVRTPSFIGYIVRYSLPILLPILIITGWLMLSAAH